MGDKPCSKCGQEERLKGRPWGAACWREYCKEYQRRRRAANPRLCKECGVAMPVGTKHRSCSECRAPKPILVLVACQGCGRETLGPRNKQLCAACRKEWNRERLARRETERTAANRSARFCSCGAPAEVVKVKQGKHCTACRKEVLRLQEREHEHRRRAKKRGNGVGEVSLRELWRQFGGKCPLCKAKVTRKNGHVDHIIPLAKGGVHDQANLRILCGACNMKKSDAIPDIQLRLLG